MTKVCRTTTVSLLHQYLPKQLPLRRMVVKARAAQTGPCSSALLSDAFPARCPQMWPTFLCQERRADVLRPHPCMLLGWATQAEGGAGKPSSGGRRA
jgi:hypothetical protein